MINGDKIANGEGGGKEEIHTKSATCLLITHSAIFITSVSIMSDTPHSRCRAFLSHEGTIDEPYRRELLLQKKLETDIPFSQQIYGDPIILENIYRGFPLTEKPDYVLAGWIDNAVLEIHSACEGYIRDNPFRRLKLPLDTYRPDQNGSMGLYVATQDWRTVLEIDLWPDRELVRVFRYTRK